MQRAGEYEIGICHPGVEHQHGDSKPVYLYKHYFFKLQALCR
jgi:hypothetical protein